MKFATKLTISLLGIVLIVATIANFFVYTSILKILEEQITDRYEDLTFHKLDKIDRMLFERLGDIKLIASDPIIRSTNSTPKQITERLTEYRNNYKTYVSLSFFDMNRTRLADTSGLDIGIQHPPSLYWKEMLKGKDFVMDTSESVSLRMVLFHFAHVVRDANGVNIGVVVTRVPVNKLYDITKELASGMYEENVKLDLVNKEGLLLYSNYNRKRILKDTLADWEVLRSFRAEEKSRSFKSYYLGEEVLNSFSHEAGYLDFKGNDWILITRIPTKIAFAPAVELRNRVITISLGLTLSLVLLILFFSRTITKPIIILKDVADEIGKGRFDIEIDIKSKDEIGSLAASVAQMSKNIQETTVSRDYVNNIIKSMMNSLFVVTPEGVIQTVNQSTLAILGYTENELLNKPINEIFADKESLLKMPDVLNKDFITNVEGNLLAKDGRKIPVRFSGSVMRGADNRIRGIVYVAQDITERKCLEEELKRLASTDRLTNAYNRMKFEEIITKEIERVRRFNQPLSLIMFDIDYFKQGNDTYGHDIGDYVLKTMADVVRKSIREIDSFVRWGGEEFIVVVPSANLENAKMLAERIRKEIGNHHFDKVGKLMVSFGVTQFKREDTLEIFIKRVDDALYKAKTNGRNRVVAEV